MLSMIDATLDFLSKHSSLIVTTHDPADPDGLGAEKLLYLIAKSMGKQIRIINSNPLPEKYRFMGMGNKVESWSELTEPITGNPALVVVDTSDEYHLGEIRYIIPYVSEIYMVDHHEPNQFCTFKGWVDSTASSVCEMAVELAQAAGLKLSPEDAKAAYSGIVYDTGFFAYPKTTERTFKVALALVQAGVNPYEIYQNLNESCSIATLLLQKRALSALQIYNQDRVAIQTLRLTDMDAVGGSFEDTKNFVNIPLRGKSIEVSILLKENKEGQVICSLRSKGKVNVSKLAQTMGGGGHVTAAGFKTTASIDETLHTIFQKVSEALEEK